MSQSLFQSYMHVVFSTKNRACWLEDKAIHSEMFAYISGICRNLKCPSIITGGHIDHVHILVRMGKMKTASKLIGEIKEDSSKWIKKKSVPDFYWQNGYGCFGISATHVEIVRQYIKNQDKHHQVISYQDELRRILNRNNIQYDERYLWD